MGNRYVWLAAVILLLFLLVFAGCDLLEDSENVELSEVNDLNGSVELTEYRELRLSDFAALGESHFSQEFTDYYETNQELVGDVVESFTGGMSAFLTALGSVNPNEDGGPEFSSGSRALDALLLLRLYDEVLKTTTPDSNNPDQDVVLSELYIDYLEFILAGTINSVGELIGMLGMYTDDQLAALDFSAEGMLGISAFMEHETDAWVLEWMLKGADIGAAETSSDPDLHMLMSIFADVSADYGIDGEEEVLLLSGAASWSFGVNFVVDDNGDAPPTIFRVPVVMQAHMEPFEQADMSSLMDDNDNGDNDESNNWDVAVEAVWGEGAEDYITISLLIGDEDGNLDEELEIISDSEEAFDMFLEGFAMMLASPLAPLLEN